MRIFRMIMECLTPMHCGGGREDLLQDQPVARDAFGLWRVPGSSLAGALRSLAARRDPGMAARLFGEGGGNAESSLVWCEDGLLLDFDGKCALDKKLAGQDVAIPLEPFVRDHVRLDPEKGSAVEGGKFDAEIVPAGARFFVEFRCDGWSRRLTDEECGFFDWLCSLVLGGQLGIGGKATNGYGRYRVVDAQCREIDLFDPAGARTWLNLSQNRLFDGGEGRRIAMAPETRVPRPEGLSGTLELPLSCDAPILVGGGRIAYGDAEASEADMLFALSPRLDYAKKRLEWRAVIPGSSLKGVLRHAAYAVLRDMGMDEARAVSALNGLFGYICGDGGQCGKIMVEDCELAPQGNTVFTPHVAIDRFTGGAFSGALFSEEPVWAEDLKLPVRMHVRNADGPEAAIIFQVVFDLANGLLAVGGGANRGNGRLKIPGDQDPGHILAALGGNVSWQGNPILEGDGRKRLQGLQSLAREWEGGMA